MSKRSTHANQRIRDYMTTHGVKRTEAIRALFSQQTLKDKIVGARAEVEALLGSKHLLTQCLTEATYRYDKPLWEHFWVNLITAPEKFTEQERAAMELVEPLLDDLSSILYVLIEVGEDVSEPGITWDDPFTLSMDLDEKVPDDLPTDGVADLFVSALGFPAWWEGVMDASEYAAAKRALAGVRGGLPLDDGDMPEASAVHAEHWAERVARWTQVAQNHAHRLTLSQYRAITAPWRKMVALDPAMGAEVMIEGSNDDSGRPWQPLRTDEYAWDTPWTTQQGVPTAGCAGIEEGFILLYALLDAEQDNPSHGKSTWLYRVEEIDQNIHVYECFWDATPAKVEQMVKDGFCGEYVVIGSVVDGRLVKTDIDLADKWVRRERRVNPD